MLGMKGKLLLGGALLLGVGTAAVVITKKAKKNAASNKADQKKIEDTKEILAEVDEALADEKVVGKDTMIKTETVAEEVVTETVVKEEPVVETVKEEVKVETPVVEEVKSEEPVVVVEEKEAVITETVAEEVVTETVVKEEPVVEPSNEEVKVEAQEEVEETFTEEEMKGKTEELLKKEFVNLENNINQAIETDRINKQTTMMEETPDDIIEDEDDTVLDLQTKIKINAREMNRKERRRAKRAQDKLNKRKR